jgi:hypothetical protein
MNRKGNKKIAVMAAVIMGLMMFAFMPLASAAVTSFSVTPSTGIAGAVDSYNALVTTTGVTSINITIPMGFIAVTPTTGGVLIARVEFWNTSKGDYYGYATITSNSDYLNKVDVYSEMQVGGDKFEYGPTPPPQDVNYNLGGFTSFEVKVNDGIAWANITLPTETEDGLINITIDCESLDLLQDVHIAIKQFVRNPTTAGDYDFIADGVTATVQIVETGPYGGGVYRQGQWILRTEDSPYAMVYRFTWGNPTDVPLPGDWNGNGEDGIGVYRNGQWILRNDKSAGDADYRFNYGNPTDVPVAGDWNDDCECTIGVYRNGQWILRNDKSPGIADYRFNYGNPSDVPVTGDWNGDGEDGIGVYRNGQWILRNDKSPGIADYRFNYGNPSDVPVTGDWNGNGVDTIGVYRNGQWILRNSNSAGSANYRFNFGNPTDVPVPGTWA